MITILSWADEMSRPTPLPASHQPRHIHLPQQRQDKASPNSAGASTPPPPPDIASSPLPPATTSRPPPKGKEDKEVSGASTSEKKKRFKIPKVWLTLINHCLHFFFLPCTTMFTLTCFCRTFGPSMRIPPPRTTPSGKCIKEAATIGP